MHGIVVKGLKDYVVAEYDRPTWRSILDRADVERRLYAPAARYPNCHGTALADATMALTGADEEELAFAVGRHLAPTLLQVFGDPVTGADSGLDLLADAESAIGEALRYDRLPDAAPPDLAGERLDAETVRLRYAGDYCAGVRGLVVGLGEQYEESYRVTERVCTDGEAGYCEFVVRRSPTAVGDGALASDD